jgi:hypothetical protein
MQNQSGMMIHTYYPLILALRRWEDCEFEASEFEASETLSQKKK